MMFLNELGVACDDRGVSRDAFVEYRKRYELEHPLTEDLDRLKLGYLPQPLRLWARVKALYSEAVRARRVGSGESEDRIHVDEIAYVLHNAGIQFTREEVPVHPVGH